MRVVDPSRGQHILDSAAQLFHQHHYHEVRMEDVAAQAGVAKGTLYRYFQDKEDLYFALILRGMERFYAEVSAAMSQVDSAEDRLRVYIGRAFEFCERFPYLLGLMQRVDGSADPSRLGPLLTARQRFFHLVTDTLRDLNGEGPYRVSHPQVAAISLTGIIRQLVLFLPKPWPANLPDVVIDQYLHGLTDAAPPNPPNRTKTPKR